MKNIFIAGAGGYLGTKLTKHLLDAEHRVVAMDRFYFGDTLHELSNNKRLQILKDDIRYFDKGYLKDIETVINLAAISNDPASELDPKATKEINHIGAVRLARLAKESGVKRYVFSSSCSVYGAGGGELTESSKSVPISEYARSKIAAEKDMFEIADKNFSVTSLRMATLYGISEKRMRFDLIINIMTLHAWRDGRIFILGGGKQWRPLLHLDDAVNAFELVLNEKNFRKINKQIFNVGSNKQNFQVIQIASFFKKHFPELNIEVAPDDPDQRSYKVNFDKIKKVLKHKTKKTVDNGIKEVKEALEKGKVSDELRTNTLKYYQYLIESDETLQKIKLKGKLL